MKKHKKPPPNVRLFPRGPEIDYEALEQQLEVEPVERIKRGSFSGSKISIKGPFAGPKRRD